MSGEAQAASTIDIDLGTTGWVHLLATFTSDGPAFDGKQLYTAQDNTFAEPGKVALWTRADSVTHSIRSARPLE
jgi:hypothetical protein